jgi:DNA-binding NtrC family response regulator
MTADILLVEDEAVLRRTIAKSLARDGHAVRTAESAEEALNLVDEGPPDLLITDHRLPGMTGHDLLLRTLEAHPGVGVVLITAHGTIEDAVAAMRDGALDYLRKPIDLAELKIVVDRCLASTGLRRQLDYYRSRDLDREESGILGTSTAMQTLRNVIARLAGLEKRDGGGPTILLTGETGTGKGLTARAIHNASPRANKPFIEVNCSAIPENLLEAELFGYERGAFTDASTAKAGLLEAAEGGTIFFDEIGHMPVRLQAKLLKVIDEKSVRRLGSTRDRTVACTIFTATHMDLEAKVSAGEFLEDLFHRIHVVRVELPPLRERGEDRTALAEHFVRHHATEYGVPVPKLTEDARGAILNHRWPGNVRELSHAIERAIVLGVGDEIRGSDLAVGGEHASVDVNKGGAVAVDFSAGGIELEQVESDLIRRAMEFTEGNQAQAARLLGLSRDALRYRLEKFGLR